MNRTKLLAIAVPLLLIFAIVHHIWANWGLVTVHVKEQPLSKVILSIERQGHANIQTDLPSDTPVSMDVDKVPLTDALETLSVATESRWRLLYFVAETKTAIKDAEQGWFGGTHPDDWRMLSFPMGNLPGLDADEAAPLDPRDDVWNPKTAAPAPLQDFFKEAASATNASFAFPTSWNPTVKSEPPSGTVQRVVPKLVSAAGGREDQIFFLSKALGRRGPGNNNQNGNGGVTEGDFRPDFDLITARTQAEINRLPADQQSDAQMAFDSEQSFRQSLQAITDPDARQQAIQQHMQDPKVQQQMANRMDGADSRMSHDQRMQHYQNYVNRKLTAMGKM